MAALRFIERVLDDLDEYGRAMEAEKRPWIAAEYLIALRYLQGRKVI